MSRSVTVLALVTLILSGCAAKQQEPVAPETADSERWRKTDEAVVNALQQAVDRSAARGGVTHVVFLWLKTPGDAGQIEKIIETSRGFREIPGVLSVRAGRAIPSTRPVVDSSYDVGLVMTFRDEAALNAYETHPQHVKAVQEVLRPLAARIQVYDIKEEAGPSSAPASVKQGE